MFKKSKSNWLGLSFSSIAVLILMAGIDSPSLAQSQYEQDNGYQSNEKNSTFGDTPAGLDPVELIHRAQQLNRRSAEEFNEEYEGQLNNSVSDFKRLQQQQILQQQGTETPAVEVVE
ncbi:MAG: hypothetical protein AAGE96_19570 [Cyanobacteria bacterium P01_G01_bin.19]